MDRVPSDLAVWLQSGLPRAKMRSLLRHVRQNSGDERTRQLLIRSYRQIDLSRDLLEQEPAKTGP